MKRVVIVMAGTYLNKMITKLAQFKSKTRQKKTDVQIVSRIKHMLVIPEMAQRAHLIALVKIEKTNEQTEVHI